MKLYPQKGFCLLADREDEGKACGADFGSGLTALIGKEELINE